ncbi:MAG: hypothetical protein IPJ88_02080 [Myxococcales bacterium]|nr:MAG: hypothetical protein IPJ88_02080 [Myxococcales bacterium]
MKRCFVLALAFFFVSGCGRIGYDLTLITEVDGGPDASSDSGELDAPADANSNPACEDTIKNFSETDVDCGGGECPACADDAACVQNSDCLNGYCNPSLLCASPTCSDGAQNQNEAGVDCGGPCPACQVQSLSFFQSPVANSSETFAYDFAFDNDTLVVGAPAAAWPYAGSGAVYVYRRDQSGAFNFDRTITYSASAPNDGFGNAVALENGTLVVGASAMDDNGFTDTGRAVIYEEQPDLSWKEVANLINPNPMYDYAFLAQE